MAGRDTPKDLQDAIPYDENPDLVSNMASVSQGDLGNDKVSPGMAKKVAQECYESSTNWLNAGRRLKWTNSLRAFQGEHPSGSKYLSTDYQYRSRIFRPKTRAMVRKGEAATAAAFFSNDDVVNIQPQDDNDPQQLASAKINQHLLQYRLTKTIPWFLTLVGARQDCEVMGIAIGKCFWKYSEKYTHTEKRPVIHHALGTPLMGADGQPIHEDIDHFKKTSDHPWIDLVAPENYRFDAGADWRNPVATSPYNIELIPMYVCDVQAKIEAGEWLHVGESSLWASSDLDDDTTRRARELGRVPGKDQDAWKPRQYDICWVRENIIRFGGRDWHYYTLSSSGALLTMPKPIEEVYLQGVRPYVCGFIIPEAHKTYPSGKVEMVRDLQTQTNDVANLRLDNVKLTLNPRQFLKAGSGADPQDARIFNPGKVVITKDPRNDIVWDRPPDATASSFEEQDRINLDFDELAGGTSNQSIQQAPNVYQAVGNTDALMASGTQLEEYEQRVFAETFVEPILRQLVLLEQAYETDPVVLAIAGKEAQLYQKFGINEITDELLKQELTIKVNVGIGATNPQTRLRNFAAAGEMLGKMYGPLVPMASNFNEVWKEVFSLCGYKDGERFMKPNFDPEQAMQMQNGGKKGEDPQQKMQIAQMQVQADMQTQKQRGDIDMQIARQQMDMQMQQFQMQSVLKQKEMELTAETQKQNDLREFVRQQRHDHNEMVMEQQKSENELRLKREIEMLKLALQAHKENNEHVVSQMRENGAKPEDVMAPFMEIIKQMTASNSALRHVTLDNGRKATITVGGE